MAFQLTYTDRFQKHFTALTAAEKKQLQNKLSLLTENIEISSKKRGRTSLFRVETSSRKGKYCLNKCSQYDIITSRGNAENIEISRSMKANKAYKFRIYPSNKQKRKLAQNFGCTRFVFNHFLAYQCDSI